MRPDVIIGHGKLAGKGVFAGREFKRGEVVIRYHLKSLTEKEYQDLSRQEKTFVHTHSGVKQLYGEPERYVNHSDQPNTYQDLNQRRDIALRDIKTGEMITTDAEKDEA